jgi:7-cyano-7-deazaguanine synthase
MIGKRRKRVKKTVCVLVSGGIDSSVLVADLGRRRRVQPLYLRCGLKWEDAEIHWLGRFLASLPRPLRRNLLPLAVLKMPADDLIRDGRHWSVSGIRPPGYRSRDETVYLPGRNLLFLSKAATFCAVRKIPTLVIGSLSGNPFPDATPGFLRAMERASRLALNHPVRFLAPFRTLSKKDVVRKGRGLPLHLCFSCLSPRGLKPCGRCNKCAERDKALRVFRQRMRE